MPQSRLRRRLEVPLLLVLDQNLSPGAESLLLKLKISFRVDKLHLKLIAEFNVKLGLSYRLTLFSSQSSDFAYETVRRISLNVKLICFLSRSNLTTV